MKNLFSILLVLFCLSDTYAQIGIKANNTAPIPSAQLEVQSTTKAFYPPRMTTVQKNAIAGVSAGAIVYDTDLNGLFTYNGSAWVSGSGLTLPYSVSQNEPSSILLRIENTNVNTTFSTIFGGTSSNTHNGINGIAFNTNPSGSPSAIKGVNISTNANGYGIYGEHSGSGKAVYGISAYGVGGYFTSSNGKALKTDGSVTIGGTGVGTLGANKFLKSINSSGDAEWNDLLPYSLSTTSTAPILKVTNLSIGGHNGITSELNSSGLGFGVQGIGTNTNPSFPIAGVLGSNYSTNSLGYGIVGTHSGTGTAVRGETSNGIGGFFTSTTGSALLTDAGKVGFGTSIPKLNADERVDINGRLRIRDSLSTAGVWFNNSANSTAFADGAFHGMKINTETGIFIGGNWRFWVNSAGNATLTGTLTQSSDRRLKKDFILLTHSLSNIYNLNGYHYKWIEESRSKDLQTGLIAQEVQKIFPELVQTDEKGFLSVNYIGLIPHLIEAVKELRNENAGLKSRLDKIEAMLTNSQLSANSVINK